MTSSPPRDPARPAAARPLVPVPSGPRTSGPRTSGPRTSGPRTSGFRRRAARLSAARLRGVSRPVGWSLLGLAVSALAQWAVIVMLARYGGPVMLGQYALGLAIGAPATLLAGLGLRSVLVTDAGGRYGFGEYLRLRAVGMSVAVLLILVVVLATGARHGAVIGLVATAKALDGIGDIYLGLFQRHHRMRPISVSMIINGMLTLAAMATLLALTGDIVATACGSVLGSALGSVGYCWYAARRMPAGSPVAVRSGSARRLASLAVLALPVGLASGLTSVCANLPRYLVGQHLGAAALGLFAALGYVVLAANTLFGAVAQAMLPRMADLYAAGEITALARLTRRLAAGALLLGAGGAALAATLGGPLLDLAYGAGYARHASLLTVLTIAVAFTGTVYFVSIALLAVRRFRNYLVTNAVALALVGGIGCLLIPYYGLAGAAWTVVLALAAESLLKTAVLRRALVAARATRAVTGPPGASKGSPAASTVADPCGVGPSKGRRRR